jgi:DNA-binding winged helix-turn-helix (wHTH) protein
MFVNPAAEALRNRVEHIVYIFEGFRLDAGRRQLSSSGGVVVPLKPRAMETLVMLVTHAGELVTKKQLLEGVWPSAVVEDNNINQCILAIRKALGESAGSNRFVMTVPGRGYRFVAHVTRQDRLSPEAADDIPAQPSSPQGRMLAFYGLAAASALALLASIIIRQPIERPPAPAGDLVVHLRTHDRASPEGHAALVDCLRQRPDLHLQVEVHVVGGDASAPLWSGEYIAGAQDLKRDDDTRDTPADACRQLAAR